LKFSPMAIPAMALLQQDNGRRDNLIEPAAWRHTAIDAQGIPNWGHSELGAQSGRKNQLACILFTHKPQRDDIHQTEGSIPYSCLI